MTKVGQLELENDTWPAYVFDIMEQHNLTREEVRPIWNVLRNVDRNTVELFDSKDIDVVKCIWDKLNKDVLLFNEAWKVLLYFNRRAELLKGKADECS